MHRFEVVAEGGAQLDFIDWNDAFDNSGYVPEATKLLDTWVSDAAEYRATMKAEGLAQLDVLYGPGPRMTFDLFCPKAPSLGTAIFIHGGYWHSRDKSDWSHLMDGLVRAGWAVAVVAYPLAPMAQMPEISDAIAAAFSTISNLDDKPIRIFGHSAGGHLAALMLSEDRLGAAVSSRIERVVAVSGVFDLRPLLLTKMNDILGLTDEDAKRHSPILLTKIDVPMTYWVGADERPEFLRQNRLAAETFASSNTRSVYAEGRNHFTVLLDLVELNAPLVAEILR